MELIEQFINVLNWADARTIRFAKEDLLLVLGELDPFVTAGFDDIKGVLKVINSASPENGVKTGFHESAPELERFDARKLNISLTRTRRLPSSACASLAYRVA